MSHSPSPEPPEQEPQQPPKEEKEQDAESTLTTNKTSNPSSPLIALGTDNSNNNNIAAPTPRLVLTQIELENFKSYYGRRIIGPFHKRFSSIVGPNGSGKSNVIDALLFVFGRRAKQIRLKKISELVHTSSSHPTCKQARVNIHFQQIIDNEMDDNEYRVIPNSSFSISRIATKSNNSTYLINNKVSKIKKVKELLLTKGIDLNNNRFLILQGEVESIAMMKPKSVSNNDDGLLEYLEDIIGSNKYILEINRCGEQVETLTNEVQERLNRVKVVERDRDKLSVAKNEAQDYIKSQLQLWKLQAVSKQVFINKYHNKADALNVQLVQFNNGIAAKEEKLTKIQQEMEDIEEKYQQIRKEKNKVEKEVKKEEKQFQEFEQSDVSMTTRLKYLKKEMNKIKKNRHKLEQEKVEFTEKIAQNETLIPRLQSEVEEMQINLRAQQAKQEEMMSELTERIQPIKEAMEEKQKELIPLKDRENSIKQKLDIIANNISAINDKVTDAQQRKQDIVNRIADIDTNIDAQTNNLDHTLQNELQTHNTNKSNMNKHIKALRNEEKKLQYEITHTRKDYDNARYLYENAAKSKQRIVGLLLGAQEKGDLTGVLGRLGDLGSIDQKYDVAASTAATSALNFIVVEKTHHAQRAVEYLKRHNLGRATMLILEKQKHLQRAANKKIATPQGVNRLYDLVRFGEERFNIAFYFAFRDTLVATDLNEANNLAFSGGRRWRVVTLQGQLIETSGAMTGGGNKVFKGLMSDRIVDEGGHITEGELREKEQTLRTMENRLTEIVREVREGMAQIKQCQKSIDRLEVNKRKLRMEINGLQQRKLALEGQIPEIEAMTEVSEDDEAHLQGLEEEKKQRNEEFLAAQHDCELLEDVIRDLEEKILENGGNSLREQKNLQDRLKRKLKEKSKLRTKLEVEIKSLGKKLKSSGQKFGTMEDNVVEMKAEYDEIKLKKKDLEEKAVALMTVLDGKKDVLREKDLEYSKLSKIVEKNNGMMTKLTKDLFEEQEKMKNVKSELGQTRNRMKKSKNEWVGLQTKFNKNKHEFLRDDEDEDDTQKATAMEVDNEDTDIKEVDEGKMDVDDMEDDDDKHDEEEKEAMEVAVGKNDISLREYLREHTLKLINLCSDLLSQVDPSLIDAEITEIKSILEASAVNMGAIEAYFVKDSEYVDRLKDLKECKKNRDLVRGEYEVNKRLRFDSFMSGFSAITKKLKEMYRMLTCGGDAELELVDSIDPFSEGVQFSVRPPKKSWKNISNLSGGEKTLSSMALVFALHHYKPTPLYVMDEIDAALDFKNVSIVANYIHQRTKNAQFIIISLRNNMFELANRLVGIYKTNNASKSITIDPQLFKLPSINNTINKQMQMPNHSGNVNHNVNVNVNVKHNDNDNEDEDDDILVNKVNENHNDGHNHNHNHNHNDMIDID